MIGSLFVCSHTQCHKKSPSFVTIRWSCDF